MSKKWIFLIGAMVVLGCSEQGSDGEEDPLDLSDADADSDVDADSDSDADGDSDADSDADSDSDADGECIVGSPLAGGTPYCDNGLDPLGNGYSYEIWMADAGSGCATMYGVDAAFRAEWDLGDGGDFLARAGLYFGATQPHNEIGTISADYAFIKPDDNGFSWVAIYGWTFAAETFGSLMEYYIVEDWSVYRPATNYDHLGTLDVDGGTYDIYYNRRENAMSPKGLTDFDQIWSIRKEPRDCGHVSISEHFNAWDDAGLDVSGLLRESMLLVEALNGSGTVDFTSVTVQVE